MSWFTRSIANTLNLNEEAQTQNDQNNLNEPSSSNSPRGVKDDLSELTQTLTRQFWGVASFLSPPAQPEPVGPEIRSSDDDEEDSGEVTIAGIRSDLTEIGGKFKIGISKISENINVSEFGKIASNFMKLAVDGREGGEEDEEEEDELVQLDGVVGVTEEVVAFVEDLATSPENWLDFPLDEEEDEDGFDMTDAQQEHALAVERLAPRLAALRMELVPEYMSESCFWMIYFVLLHPELDKEDAAILSTPQIMDSQVMLSRQLQNESDENLDNKSGEVIVAQHEESPLVISGALSEHASQKKLEAEPVASTGATNCNTIIYPVNSTGIHIVEGSATSNAAADCASEKHAIVSTGIEIVDKSAIEVGYADHNKGQSVHSSPSNSWENREEDEADDWLKEDTSEIDHASGTTVPIENDEDVSFSDLEDDDEDEISILKKVNYTSDKDSREWVQL